MQRLGLAMGGVAETFSGLTGLGDLVLTATGALSRNRQVGLAIAQGQTLDTILAGGMTAEGVRCARAALTLGHTYGVDLRSEAHTSELQSLMRNSYAVFCLTQNTNEKNEKNDTP